MQNVRYLCFNVYFIFVCSTSYRESASIGVNTKVEQQHDPEAILHIAGMRLAGLRSDQSSMWLIDR